MAQRLHTVLYGALDGSRGQVLPVTEEVYRRLEMVQTRLNVVQPHVAGLNPRALHALARRDRALHVAERGVLDGDLLWTFSTLSIPEQREVAARFGMTPAQVLDDLLHLTLMTPRL